MILDPNKIKQNINGEILTFEYPLEFKGVAKTAKIEIIGAYPNRKVNVFLINENGEEEQKYEFVSSEDQSEVKESWEKFEDLFNESDEGGIQQGQDEIENLYTSFDKSGNAVLFLQNLEGDQKIITSYEISDINLLKNQPATYELDFENNQILPEPLRAKWLMANVSDSVKCMEFPNYPFTYQVAILSIQPPQPPQPPTDEESDEMPFFRLVSIVGINVVMKQYSFNKKTNTESFVQDVTFRLTSQSEPLKVETPQGEGTLVPYSKFDIAEFKAYLIATKGENPPPDNPTPPDTPQPPDDGEPKDDEEPKDDGEPKDDEEPSDDNKGRKEKKDLEGDVKYNFKFDTNQFTEAVAKYMNKSPLDIQRSMRSTDSFRDLLEIYNVKVSDIAPNLGLPTNQSEFYKEVKKIIGR